MAKILLDTEELYSTTEAARLIGIGYATLFRWIKAGDLIPLKIVGRTFITKSEVERIKALRGGTDAKIIKVSSTGQKIKEGN